MDADFQYPVSPKSTLSGLGDGDEETVHTLICELADNEVLEVGLDKN